MALTVRVFEILLDVAFLLPPIGTVEVLAPKSFGRWLDRLLGVAYAGIESRSAIYIRLFFQTHAHIIQYRSRPVEWS